MGSAEIPRTSGSYQAPAKRKKTWKKRAGLAGSAERLRLYAIAACTVAFFAASALPAVTYYYVYKMDHMQLGPQAWAHWGVCLVACLLGIVGNGTASTGLTALHVALGSMLGAALGGYNTAMWFTMDLRCQSLQADEVCSAVLLQRNNFILAFTGLASVVCLAFPVCFSILVLVRSEAARALRAARHQAVAFAVDTQTSLVVAGDKPTVTPQMLAEWVGYLLDVAEQEGDEGCGLVAERCRASLAQRGYNLPVVRAPQPAQGRQQKWCGLSLVFYNGKAPPPNSPHGDVAPSAPSFRTENELTVAEQGQASPKSFYLGPQGSLTNKSKAPRRPQVANAEELIPSQRGNSTVYPPY